MFAVGWWVLCLSWLCWWAVLLPCGCVSWSVGDLVLSVGDKQHKMLRYVCVMVGDVFEVSSSQVLTCGQCGLQLVYAVIHAAGSPSAPCLRWPFSGPMVGRVVEGSVLGRRFCPWRLPANLLSSSEWINGLPRSTERKQDHPHNHLPVDVPRFTSHDSVVTEQYAVALFGDELCHHTHLSCLWSWIWCWCSLIPTSMIRPIWQI